MSSIARTHLCDVSWLPSHVVSLTSLSRIYIDRIAVNYDRPCLLFLGINDCVRPCSGQCGQERKAGAVTSDNSLLYPYILSLLHICDWRKLVDGTDALVPQILTTVVLFDVYFQKAWSEAIVMYQRMQFTQTGEHAFIFPLWSWAPTDVLNLLMKDLAVWSRATHACITLQIYISQVTLECKVLKCLNNWHFVHLYTKSSLKFSSFEDQVWRSP